MGIPCFCWLVEEVILRTFLNGIIVFFNGSIHDNQIIIEFWGPDPRSSTLASALRLSRIRDDDRGKALRLSMECGLGPWL